MGYLNTLKSQFETSQSEPARAIKAPQGAADGFILEHLPQILPDVSRIMTACGMAKVDWLAREDGRWALLTAEDGSCGKPGFGKGP